MKGIVFIIESIIAVTLIVFIVFFVLRSVESVSDLNLAGYKLKAYESLTSLERKNELRYYAVNYDVQSINNSLSSLLPNNINYYVVIFNKISNVTSMPNLENKKNVVSVDYIISGDYNIYDPRIVTVFLWG